MKNLLLVLLLIPAFLSCQHSPFSHRYTTEKPEVIDIVGVYEFDFQTVDDNLNSEDLKAKPPEIVIKPNGTFEIRRLPVFKKKGIAEYKFERAVFRSGKWSLETLGSIDNGWGNVDRHWGLVLDSVPEELKYAGFLGRDKVNGIIFGYGDPDAGNVMIFNKK